MQTIRCFSLVSTSAKNKNVAEAAPVPSAVFFPHHLIWCGIEMLREIQGEDIAVCSILSTFNILENLNMSLMQSPNANGVPGCLKE